MAYGASYINSNRPYFAPLKGEKSPIRAYTVFSLRPGLTLSLRVKPFEFHDGPIFAKTIIVFSSQK